MQNQNIMGMCLYIVLNGPIIAGSHQSSKILEATSNSRRHKVDIR